MGAWTGGGGCADVRNVLYSGGSGSAYIPVGDVGHFPTYREEYGRVPPLGGTEIDGVDATAEPIWDVEIPFPGGGDVRCGRAGSGTYVFRRQNTVTQCITTSPIMDLCLAAAWRPGYWLLKRFW